ncbi:MAG: 50S ribosomal protein L32 [Coriobacteriales bacterium]|jgi:large subunit ribosomal protein L32|nr:50S ribosomal protein L32 [Coriobacteriales bacterium]
MAVPKRRTGRARTHARRSANDKAPVAPRAVCSKCGAVTRPHFVCGNCGHYKGREVIIVD